MFLFPVSGSHSCYKDGLTKTITNFAWTKLLMFIEAYYYYYCYIHYLQRNGSPGAHCSNVGWQEGGPGHLWHVHRGRGRCRLQVGPGQFIPTTQLVNIRSLRYGSVFNRTAGSESVSRRFWIRIRIRTTENRYLLGRFVKEITSKERKKRLRVRPFSPFCRFWIQRLWRMRTSSESL